MTEVWIPGVTGHALLAALQAFVAGYALALHRSGRLPFKVAAVVCVAAAIVATPLVVLLLTGWFKGWFSLVFVALSTSLSAAAASVPPQQPERN